MFELCKLQILIQWHCVMQSSNGKNQIESDLTMNWIEPFSSWIAHH